LINPLGDATMRAVNRSPAASRRSPSGADASPAHPASAGMDGGGYVSRSSVRDAVRDMTELRRILGEHGEQKKTINALEAALNDEEASMKKLQTERDELQKELDEAKKSSDMFREVARGATTFACSGAAVLSAHMEYSVTTLLPALIACAVQLRDYERTSLVVRWFTFIVVAIAVVHAGSRCADQFYHVTAIKELGASNQYRNVCSASDGRGMLAVSIAGVPFKLSCARATDECLKTPVADACSGIPMDKFDSNSDGQLSFSEADLAVSVTLPQIVQTQGWVNRCTMAGSGPTKCFDFAGDDALLQPQEYNEWLRCIFKTRKVVARCVELACEPHDDL